VNHRPASRRLCVVTVAVIIYLLGSANGSEITNQDSIPSRLARISKPDGFGSTKSSGELSARLSSVREGEPVKVWVHFTDKNESPEVFRKAAAGFSSRAMQRRGSRPVDWYDLPVTLTYVDEVIRAGGQNARASRWLNAVSAYLTADQIEILSAKPFVRKIDPVALAIRSPDPEVEKEAVKPVIDSAGYGQSYTQNHMLGIDSLHRLGLSGTGVLIAFLDTGYEIYHPAFDSMHILHTWDFIHGDTTVNDETSTGQTAHGTATMSACGGFAFGQLIGPAFKADYLAAETEYQNLEIPSEEDNWVLAAEWADSLGADIISSSLGYIDWYTYADMDGNTAVTTIAADIAASRGILVVVSAGNEGTSPWHYINAPADADSIIAVAAVNGNGAIASFSSYGPTADGRLKPELAAMGVGTRCADALGNYTYKTGTSLSTPLIAGAAALVLEANSSLRGQPMEIRRRLMESADRFDRPDYQYGYGVPDGVIAAGFGIHIQPIPTIDVRVGQDTVVSIQTLAPIGATVVFDPYDIPYDAELVDQGDGTATLRVRGDMAGAGARPYHLAVHAGEYTDTLAFDVNTLPSLDPVRVGPNPFTDSVIVRFDVSVDGGFKIEVFTLSGELVYCGYGGGRAFTWPGTNDAGEKVASGVYIIRVSADGIEKKVKVLKL